MATGKKMTKEIYEALMVRMSNMSQAFWFISKSLSVFIADKPNYNGEPAITFGNNLIIYNDFANLNWEERETVLVHLILHWIKRHSVRNNNVHIDYSIDSKMGKEAMNELLNFVEDCQLDHIMQKKYQKAPKRFEMVDQSGFKVDWDRESMEQIIRRLMEQAEKKVKEMLAKGEISINVISTNEAKANGLAEETEEMDKIQKGEMERKLEKAKKEGRQITEEEEEKMTQSHIKTKIMAAKKAGRGQDDIISSLAGEFESPEVPWYRLIISSIQHHLKSYSDSTWAKSARRSSDMPGEYTYSKPKVWVTVDTSGSVDDDQMMRFWSETAGILPYVREVEFVQWDDGVHKRDKFKRGDKLAPYRSSGGTQYGPVITKLFKEFERGDILINMTDGYWADCKQEMDSLKRKHMKTILVTTGETRYGFKQVYHVTPVNKQGSR